MEPYTIVGGVPVKLIRKRYDPENIRELEALHWWDLPSPQIKQLLPFIKRGDAKALIEAYRQL